MHVNLLRAISHLELAPGWRVHAYEHEFEGQYVCFTGHIPDSYHGEDSATVLKVRSPVPPYETKDMYLDWLLWRWLIICSHEGREFFRYRGAPWRDPHAEETQ